ncbi:MAG: ribbon-helix-helix protein, CopG family [Pyrobaculum sp.]
MEKKNRYRIVTVSLDNESTRILDELSNRWGASRSDTIRRVINIFYTKCRESVW